MIHGNDFHGKQVSDRLHFGVYELKKIPNIENASGTQLYCKRFASSAVSYPIGAGLLRANCHHVCSPTPRRRVGGAIMANAV